MLYLKKDTASQEVMIGPFVDSTDGVTAETGLSIANTDIRIHKTGTSVFANKNSGGGTHIEDGFYLITMDATDTNTAGPLKMQITMAGALPVWEDVWIHGSNIYNAWMGTIHQTTDVNAWLGAAAPDLPQAITDVAAILVDTATTIPGTITALDAVVDTVKAETVLILADTNELQSDDVPGLISTLDAVVDTVKAETALIVADTNELQTDNVPGLIASLDAVVDTVKAETVLILADTAEIGTAGAGLSAIPTQDANVVTWLGEAIPATSTTGRPKVDTTHWFGNVVATPSVAGVPEVDLTHVTGSATVPASLGYWAGATHTGLAQAGAAGSITLASGEAANTGTLDGNFITIASGLGEGQTRRISTYYTSTKIASVSQNWSITPDSTSYYFITPTSWETDNAAIATAILAGSVSEPTAGDEAWSGLTVEKLLGAAYVLLKNEQSLNRTTNAGTVRNNADNANLMTFTDDDDGTTFSKGKRGT